MDEAERLCSRLLVLDHGRKIAEGRPRELIAEHLEREVVEVRQRRAGAGERASPRLPRWRRARGQRRDRVLLHPGCARPAAGAGRPAAAAHLHRPANLEDLFLGSPGRQIREDG